MKLLWVLILMVCTLLGAVAVVAQDTSVRHGLMWNRKGLPAVFPLLVKTGPGQDYYLVLQDVKEGDAALAAYIKGGQYFKVLVPPGTYHVHVAYGVDWQGEDLLFGDKGQTKNATLPQPLTFKIKDFRTKSGHVLDLRSLAPGRDAQIRTGPQDICQSYRLAQKNRDEGVVAASLLAGNTLPDTLEVFADPLAAARAALDIDLVFPEQRKDESEKREFAQIMVRSKPC